jgi:hypothetical protein
MGDFAYQVQRSVKPEVLMRAATRVVEGARGWHLDTRDSRSFVISRRGRTGIMRLLLMPFELSGEPLMIIERDQSGYVDAYWGAKATTPGAQFLSLHVQAGVQGAELKIRGSGGAARAIARRVMGRLKRMTDAEVERTT